MNNDSLELRLERTARLLDRLEPRLRLWLETSFVRPRWPALLLALAWSVAAALAPFTFLVVPIFFGGGFAMVVLWISLVHYVSLDYVREFHPEIWEMITTTITGEREWDLVGKRHFFSSRLRTDDLQLRRIHSRSDWLHGSMLGVGWIVGWMTLAMISAASSG